MRYLVVIFAFLCVSLSDISAQDCVVNAFDDLKRSGEVAESESIMRVKPTAAQLTKLVASLPDYGYFCFTQSRDESVRMFDIIPQSWALRDIAELNKFQSSVRPNEFFTFQVATWAVKKELRGVKIDFSDFRTFDGKLLSKSVFRCFNTGGTDIKGVKFTKNIDVARRAVQPFWIGVDVPPTANGSYVGNVTITPENSEPTTITVTLDIQGEPLESRGLDNAQSMARLMWLDSQIAVNDQPTKPYIPLDVNGRTISYLGGKVVLGTNGLPSSITTNYTQMNQIDRKVKNEVLSAPMRFVIETQKGIENLKPTSITIKKESASRAIWSYELLSDNFEVSVVGSFEFDGLADFSINVKALSTIEVKDMRLEVPYTIGASKYITGIGNKGGERQMKEYNWRWDVTKHQDAIWMGGINSGLNLKFKDKNYVRPLVNIYYQYGRLNLPKSWGTGGITIGNDAMLKAYSSSRTLQKGEVLDFGVEMLITPVKPLAWQTQIKERMYHSNSDLSDKYIESASAAGANLVNIHHKKEIYPYINYPYYDQAMGDFAKFIQDARDRGIGTRVYYTTRELTVKIPEIWALRSMGDEIIHSGLGEYQSTLINGKGPNKWLSENLKTDFIPAWYNAFKEGKYKGEMDISVITTPDSRWNNYFLEGLNFMTTKMGVMGIYIDDSALDRQTLKRARNILDADGKKRLIDIHSWNHFNDWAGYANSLQMYADLLPSVDKIWIGEGFAADNSLDFWLVEMSGIPFGLMSETLDACNIYRGLIFSMTPRLGWSGNPVPIWQMWDSFGMENAKMAGYWCDDAPITSGVQTAPVTTYINGNRAVVVCANWTESAQTVKLNVDENLLGFKPSKATMIQMDGVQNETPFELNNETEIAAKGGLIILIEK